MGYVEMGVKYAMGESSTLYRRRLHAQGYLCGDFKKHLTAASDSGHRGLDEPSLTRPLWVFVSARSLGSSHFWSSVVCLVPCTEHIITERVRKACFHGRVRRWTHGASARLIHGLIHGASARHL